MPASAGQDRPSKILSGNLSSAGASSGATGRCGGLMKKRSHYLLNLAACLVLLLAQQPPAAWAAHPRDGEEPPDDRHSGLFLPEQVPGAEPPVPSADIQATNALADWSKIVFQSYRDSNWEIYR